VPRAPTLENYRALLTDATYLRYVVNTLLVGTACVVFSLVAAAPAAYAVARGRFPAKDSMLFVLWTTIMMPGAAIVVPLYLVWIYTGLYDSYVGLIIAFCTSVIPTLVWLLRGFVIRIPVDLEHAARIDGCTRWQAFTRITVPLMAPGLIAGAVLSFVTIWNEFLIAFSLTQRTELRMIQVGIYSFVTEVGIEWGRMMAAVVISVVPILVLYGLLQRRFVQGLTGQSS
jgi:ABC-type glycerol-3-phosphate transport system permease component